MSETFNPTVDLRAAPTIQRAIFDEESLYRIVVGPVGSGKSYTFGSTELMRIAMAQHVFPGTTSKDSAGIRRSRFAIIRNTSPELKSTTIKTWTELWDEEVVGPVIYSSPITHRIQVPSRNGVPGLDAEFMFLGLDRPADIAKLKSLEVTAIWANECSELPPELMRYLRRRVGRFPPKRSGIEAVRPCIIGDSNAVDEDHWLAEWAKDPPRGFAVYVQPPAVLEVKKQGAKAVCIEKHPDFKGRKFPLADAVEGAGRLWVVNPEAENLANLRSHYYEDQIAGATLAEIQRDLQAKWVYVQDGKPCVPSYQDDLHSFAELPVLKGQPLKLGLDVGGGTLNPCGVWAQRHSRGNWLIHDETVCADMGVENFAKALQQTHAEISQRAGFDVELEEGFGDPAAAKGDEVYEVAVFDHLRRLGIRVRPAQSNDPKLRVEAWEGVCTRWIDGKPALMIHKRCRRLRKALSGGWHYKRMQVSGREMFQDKPHKNHPDSDLGDAGGYLLMGGGEIKRISRDGHIPQAQNVTHQAAVDFDVFNS